MSPQEVVEAVLEWVLEVLDPDIEGSYDYASAGKSQALPDVAVTLARIQLVASDPRFPSLNMQGRWVRLFDVEASFFVSNGESTDVERAAELQLRDFAARLGYDMQIGSTLRGRVPGASQPIFDFVPEFAEYADGTRGREIRMSLTVGDPTEVTR